MKQSEQLQEKVSTGGGATGTAHTADPVAKNATLPASKHGNGDSMQKINDPNNPGIEDTSSENNAKPTGDKSAANRSSVGMKGSDASATQSYSFTPNAVKEDLNVMFSGEDLTEDFKEKATAIFEAAVSMRVAEQVSAFEAKLEESLAEQVDQFQQEIAQKVDDYMNYVVEQWMQENEVAIESSLRSEVTSDFMAGIKRVFEENYLEIPEERVDVLAGMSEELDSVTEKYNALVSENIELKKAINESLRDKILADVSEGLVATQAEKLIALSEGVDFDSPTGFRKKLELVKENYFPSPKRSVAASLNEEVSAGSVEEEKPEVSGPMAHYVQAISKTLNK